MRVLDIGTYRGSARGLRPWGMLLALSLLLAFEFGLARRDWIWGWWPKSESGVIDAVERQVIAEAEAPAVLFLGSSRVRDAVSPREVEEQLGLRRGTVLNLAVTNGTPFDALTLYRRNREKLRSAKVAFFGVEVFQVDGARPLNERVRRFATLRERFIEYGGDDRLSLLMGALWRTLDTKEPMRRFLKANYRGYEPEPLPITSDGRVVWYYRTKSTRSVQSYVREYLDEWRLNAKRVGLLDELVRTLHADGIDVVLIQVPVRRGWWRYAREHYADEVDAYYDQIRQVAEARGVPFMEWEEVPVHGLRDRDFFDWGHMQTSGAKKFSRRLAALLWAQHRASLPEGAQLRPTPRVKRDAKRKTKRVTPTASDPDAVKAREAARKERDERRKKALERRKARAATLKKAKKAKKTKKAKKAKKATKDGTGAP